MGRALNWRKVDDIEDDSYSATSWINFVRVSKWNDFILEHETTKIFTKDELINKVKELSDKLKDDEDLDFITEAIVVYSAILNEVRDCSVDVEIYFG